MNTKKALLLQFFDHSGGRLYTMLTRLTLDKDAAEELMQDLFIRLFEIKHLEKIENLRAYASRIAINLAFDRRRKQRFFKPIPGNQIDNQTEPVHLKLVQQEELEQILDAAEQLSDRMRECFVLRYIEQMDYEAIAERTYKTAQQVRGLCSKGIRRIRQILNEKNASFYKEAINE